jgi:hypothetical protein
MANEDEAPKWDSEDIACRNTYTLLIGLEQLTEPFTPAGQKQMKQLAFWNKTTSDTLRRLTAAGLAAHLDKFYMKVLLARYEEGFEFHHAIEVLADILCSADKTLSELAQTVNAIYHFRGET